MKYDDSYLKLQRNFCHVPSVCSLDLHMLHFSRQMLDVLPVLCVITYLVGICILSIMAQTLPPAGQMSPNQKHLPRIIKFEYLHEKNKSFVLYDTARFVLHNLPLLYSPPVLNRIEHTPPILLISKHSQFIHYVRRRLRSQFTATFTINLIS